MENELRFKSPSGQWLLKAIFFETIQPVQKGRGYSPIYTLKDYDMEGIPSLRKLYLETEDLEEHLFAVTHLGGWEHWNSLTKCKWFKPYVEEWRIELEAKLRSRALKSLLDSMGDLSSRERLGTAKYLLDGKWKRNSPTSKDTSNEVEERLDEELSAGVHLLSDYKREVNG